MPEVAQTSYPLRSVTDGIYWCPKASYLHMNTNNSSDNIALIVIKQLQQRLNNQISAANDEIDARQHADNELVNSLLQSVNLYEETGKIAENIQSFVHSNSVNQISIHKKFYNFSTNYKNSSNGTRNNYIGNYATERRPNIRRYDELNSNTDCKWSKIYNK
jgi:hypothetical protein